MDAKEKPNRNYLLWTLLTMFAIVAVVGIYRSHEATDRSVKAQAEVLALEALMLSKIDPTLAFERAKASFAMDSTNVQTTDLFYDLYFNAETYPFYQVLGAFPHATDFCSNQDGTVWGIVQGNQLQLLDLEGQSQKSVPFEETIWESAIYDGEENWAVVDAKHQLHLKQDGKNSIHQLEERGLDYVLKYSPSGDYLACLSDESIAIWDFKRKDWLPMSRTPIGVQPVQGSYKWLVFDSTEKALAYCLHERDVYLVELPSGNTQVARPKSDSLEAPYASGGIFYSNELLNRRSFFTVNGENDLYGELPLTQSIPREWVWKPMGHDAMYTIPFATAGLPGTIVHFATGNSAFRIQEGISNGETEVLATTASGAVVQFDRWSLEVEKVYACGANEILAARVLPSGAVVALDEGGTLRQWEEGENLYVEHAPDGLEAAASSPRFDGDEVLYLDPNGGRYQYGLHNGLLEVHVDSNQVTQAREAGQWLAQGDSALTTLPGFSQLMRHKEQLFQPRRNHFGDVLDWKFLPSADKGQILAALRDPDNGLFYNRFLWLPLSTREVIRCLDAAQVMEQSTDPN